jgi:hypothetical protein
MYDALYDVGSDETNPSPASDRYNFVLHGLSSRANLGKTRCDNNA